MLSRMLLAPALAAGLSAAASARDAAAQMPVMEDPDLAVRGVVSGLRTPTTMAFVGPRELLVLEKDTGRIRHVRDGAVVGNAIDLAVNFAGERGALGVATHPAFASNRLVYVFWTWRGGGAGPAVPEGEDAEGTPLPDVEPEGLRGADTEEPFAVAARGNRVDRFVWDGARLRFDRNVLRFPAPVVESTTGRLLTSHVGGVLAFGPDGKLYVLAGDGHLRGKLQNVGGGPSATNDDFTGVIVRVEDDGTAPRDNPFYRRGALLGGEVGRNLQRVFAYGIRNSFGMAFDPIGGALWMQENGDDAIDEIQRVPSGLNSRWIQLMGPNSRYGFYRRTELQSEDGLDNPAFPPERLASTAAQAENRLYDLPGSLPRGPAFSWRHPQGLAGLGFVAGSGLGPSWRGDMLVGDTRTGSLYRFQPTFDRNDLAFSDPALADRVADNAAKGDLTESESLVAGSGFGVVTDVETGPDGDVYVLSLSQGTLYRITRR